MQRPRSRKRDDDPEQARGKPSMSARSLLRQAHNIADLRAISRKRLPKGVFEFVDRGAEDERALTAMTDAFAGTRMYGRSFIDVSRRSVATRLFGREIDFPLVIAPTGAGALCWYDGDVALARAATAMRLPFSLATGSLTSIETVAAKVPQARLWFQLYMFQDRSLSDELVERAAAADCEALILTVDSATPPNREYNKRNGFDVPFQLNLRAAADVAMNPGWFLRVLSAYMRRGGMPRHENYPKEFQRSITSDATLRTGMGNDSITWNDLTRLRDRWRGKLIVKGIVHPDDAVSCVERGVDAIVVSSHGGRIFDSIVSPLHVLPRIAEAVAGRASILLDSGIRRGSDIAKALSLGADCVMAGRAPLYGLATAGEAGVTHALGLLKQELDRSLAYLGCAKVDDLGPHLIADLPVQGDRRRP